MPRVLQYTSASRALLVGSGTSSAAFSRGSRTPVRIASGRLADENPRFDGMRNLMRCVPRSLMYSSRPKARTAHIGSVRLARENPLLVDAEPRPLRSTGAHVHLVRIAPVCLADENPRLMGAEPDALHPVPQTKNAADPSSAVKGGKFRRGSAAQGECQASKRKGVARAGSLRRQCLCRAGVGLNF